MDTQAGADWTTQIAEAAQDLSPWCARLHPGMEKPNPASTRRVVRPRPWPWTRVPSRGPAGPGPRPDHPLVMLSLCH